MPPQFFKWPTQNDYAIESLASCVTDAAAVDVYRYRHSELCEKLLERL